MLAFNGSNQAIGIAQSTSLRSLQTMLIWQLKSNTRQTSFLAKSAPYLKIASRA
ncbi:hypothetical protein BV327_04870 [Pseudomonas syringae pv. actinidiae]|nr:hypothetical protein BV327_04870 [Pseudomonas syringae pv. actinidiae]